MTKLLAIAFAVLALVLAGPAGAQDAKLMDGPDFSGLPPGTLKNAGLSKGDKAALASVAKLDPRLAQKIEKKLKRTPGARDRFVYLTKQLNKLDERIDLAELNHKKRLPGKKPMADGMKIWAELNSLRSTYGYPYVLLLQAKDKAEGTNHARRLSEIFRNYHKAYNAFRAARREKFGLHKEVGKTEPEKKKADDKPKTPGSEKTKKTKKVCSSDGILGEMNCIELLIDEEG